MSSPDQHPDNLSDVTTFSSFEPSIAEQVARPQSETGKQYPDMNLPLAMVLHPEIDLILEPGPAELLRAKLAEHQ